MIFQNRIFLFKLASFDFSVSAYCILLTTQMRKIGWPKLRCPFGRAGRSPKEKADSLSSKLSVNEEYMEAFRTKSYIEIWSKVQDQLGRTNLSSSKHSSLPPLPLYLHLSEYLLEPSQETLEEMIQGMNLHHLLMDYFEAILEACKVCELLLQSIHQTRANYRKIKKVIKLAISGHDHADHYADKQYCQGLLCELATFAVLKNPLSNISTMQFREIHDGQMALFRRLTTKFRKIKRGASFHRIWKRACGISLVISHAAVLILLLIFALHSVVGIVATPMLLAFSFGLSTKKLRGSCGGFKTRSLLDRLGEQLDVAAKGVYILINDFGTMSQMVKRLNDEVEHRKAVVDMCVRNGKCEILKEVMREFQIHESSFLDQLEELEEHIYLCFLTINRSRRLVIQAILEAHQLHRSS